jgi:hypothetical protein
MRSNPAARAVLGRFARGRVAYTVDRFTAHRTGAAGWFMIPPSE